MNQFSNTETENEIIQENKNVVNETSEENVVIDLTKEEKVLSREDKIRIRKQEIIKLVIRQTNYNEEEAKEKLEEAKYNYMEVINNYLDIEKKQDDKKLNKSVNQEIYSQLRTFMSHTYKR